VSDDVVLPTPPFGLMNTIVGKGPPRLSGTRSYQIPYGSGGYYYYMVSFSTMRRDLMLGKQTGGLMQQQIFLIPQRQLEQLIEANKVRRVFIQGLAEKQWFPVFETREGGAKSLCSVRVQAKPEVRYWADLRLLVRWLTVDCGFVEARLNLNEFEFK